MRGKDMEKLAKGVQNDLEKQGDGNKEREVTG